MSLTNIPISQLPATTSFSGIELFPVVQGGETMQATIAQIIGLTSENYLNINGQNKKRSK